MEPARQFSFRPGFPDVLLEEYKLNPRWIDLHDELLCYLLKGFNLILPTSILLPIFWMQLSNMLTPHFLCLLRGIEAFDLYENGLNTMTFF